MVPPCSNLNLVCFYRCCTECKKKAVIQLKDYFSFVLSTRLLFIFNPRRLLWIPKSNNTNVLDWHVSPKLDVPRKPKNWNRRKRESACVPKCVCACESVYLCVGGCVWGWERERERERETKVRDWKFFGLLSPWETKKVFLMARPYFSDTILNQTWKFFSLILFCFFIQQRILIEHEMPIARNLSEIQ